MAAGKMEPDSRHINAVHTMTTELRRNVSRGVAVLVLLLVAVAPVFAQSVAMVTDLTGKAALQAAPGKGSLAILSEVAADARVQLEGGARLTVVYLASRENTPSQDPRKFSFVPTNLRS